MQFRDRVLETEGSRVRVCLGPSATWDENIGEDDCVNG